jgi:hypothetical protein
MRSKFLLGCLVAGLALTSAVSSAQPVPKPLPPQLANAPRLRPVTVTSELRAALAKKPLYSEAALLKSVRFDASGAILHHTGADFRLLPLEDPHIARMNLPVQPLPRDMSKFAGRVERFRGGVIPPLDALVTHDVNHTSGQSPIKNQGSRGTCSAFATVAGLEGLQKRANPTQGFQDYSENDVFNAALTYVQQPCTQTGGVHTWATVQSTVSGLCAESAFPYTSTCPPPSIPQACSSAANGRFGHVYSMGTAAHPVPAISTTDPQRQANNVALLESWLTTGKDVVFALDVAGSDWSAGGKIDTGIIDVQVDSHGNPAPAVGAHAILLVGYHHPADPNQPKYFIFKNSWGPTRGHDGYLWISYDYVQTYAWYGFAVLD